MASSPTAQPAQRALLHPLPLGPRLEAALELAYRARRAVLLEGPTGIGKSEIVRAVTERLGIKLCVLDLSLLEPPDLAGLPVIENGRTSYALPHILPTDGAGILMLEELNRAERYIQQPALQLLTARTLHEYELPAGWVCFAAINPESADYQVTTLDKALRARFLELHVRADRGSWLAWAQTHSIHPGVVALVQAHERVFDEIPPRTWTYVSSILSALRPGDMDNGTLIRDVLGGYLPSAWVELVIASKAGWGTSLAFDIKSVLVEYTAAGELATKVRGYREKGETDRIDEICKRLIPLLQGPEAGVLAAKGSLKLASFEAFLSDIPGDHRERLQDALGHNATVTSLVELSPNELLQNYPGSPAEKKIKEWHASANKQHRIGLTLTALRAYLERQADTSEMKRSNSVRTCLGHLLPQVQERWAMPLVQTMQRLGITPIRPQ
jgi:AAA domain (dynein-related subfamily)